jgi:hypothetical protein
MAAAVIRAMAMAMGDTLPMDMDMVTGLIIRGLDTVTITGRIITDHTTGPTVTESIPVAVGGRERRSEENI